MNEMKLLLLHSFNSQFLRLSFIDTCNSVAYCIKHERAYGTDTKADRPLWGHLSLSILTAIFQVDLG